MSYNIVLTTAEDIVAVVDAVIAKGSEAAKDFIAEFTGIATDDQVLKALQMACELQLIVFDSSRGCYVVSIIFGPEACICIIRRAEGCVYALDFGAICSI
ncbi:MAG: hypothetical protein ACLR01_03165 [Vescimonas sp.]